MGIYKEQQIDQQELRDIQVMRDEQAIAAEDFMEFWEDNPNLCLVDAQAEYQHAQELAQDGENYA